MVRKYKAKTERGNRDGGLMGRAVEEVAKGRSVRQVARDLDINRTTLSRYVKKLLSVQTKSNDDFVPHCNTRQIFTKAEDGLVEYVLTCSLMFHGLGCEDVRRLGFEYAAKKGNTIPESWTHAAMAGKDWLLGFMNRHHNVTLRAPEKTSMARAQGFNSKAVGSFFELWSETQESKKYGPESIYNLDETGITTVQNVPKVLATRGMKQVGQITAAERGTLVTACCCISAVGQVLPPVMIFPRVHFKDHMIKGAPPGTLGLATQSGWMNSDLFPNVLRHFIQHMGCSREKPAILFMDNHESHLGIDVIEMARDNGLSIITFPPHTSHKLQPLDVSVYGPLKTHYKKAVNEWNLSNPGKRITIYDLPGCFSRAFNGAMSFQNISAGFQKTGIWPLNSDIFSKDDFLAASIFVNDTVVNADQQLATSSAADSDELVTSAHESIGINSSFEEITHLFPLPKRKATDVKTPRAKRAIVGCKLITSTPEKEKAMEKFIQKTSKKKATVQVETSEEEDEAMSVYGETSSSYEEDFEDDSLNVSNIQTKNPETGDFVLVKLLPVNSQKYVYYVARVSDVSAEERSYEVEFYRQSRKMTGRFAKPVAEDKSTIVRSDIVMCLPKPANTGGTKRVASLVKFDIDLEQYNCH